MADLIATATAMTYTDLRRRLIKAYQADSADMDPNQLGDPRLEEKLSAKLGSYGPNGFRLLLIELSEDLPQLHPEARRELAAYAIRLRDIWEADQELGPAPTVIATPLTRPDYTPFSVPTSEAMTIEAA